MSARLVRGGRLVTLDPRQPHADWLLAEAGRIVAVGLGDPPAASPDVPVIDLAGGTAYPGLIDAHAHLFAQADELIAVDCSPRAVRSIAEIQAAIAARAASLPADAWVRAPGRCD